MATNNKLSNLRLDLSYDVAGGAVGKPAASGYVVNVVAVTEFKLPEDLTGSFAKAQVAATASGAVFDIQKNGSSIGSFTFAASGTTGTFTFASDVSFALGDILTIEAPATPDDTLADLSVVLKGTYL